MAFEIKVPGLKPFVFGKTQSDNEVAPVSPSDRNDTPPIDLSSPVSPLFSIETKAPKLAVQGEQLRENMIKALNESHEGMVKQIEKDIAGKYAPLDGELRAVVKEAAPLRSAEEQAALTLKIETEKLAKAHEQKILAETVLLKEAEEINRKRNEQYKTEMDTFEEKERQAKGSGGKAPVDASITAAKFEEYARNPEKIPAADKETIEKISQFEPFKKTVAELDKAGKSFDKVRDGHDEAYSSLRKNVSRQQEIKDLMAEATAPLREEMHRHNEAMGKITEGPPNEEAKKTAITKHYQQLLDDGKIPAHSQEDVRKAIAGAEISKTSGQFISKLDAAVGDKAPNTLEWPQDMEKIGGANLRISRNEDGKLVATISRQSSKQGDEDTTIVLNESGVINMEKLKGKSITLSVDPTVQVDQKLLLVNTEGMSRLHFMAPHPGLSSSSMGTVKAKDFGNPAETFAVVGESDRGAAIRLASADRLSQFNEQFETRKAQVYENIAMSQAERQLEVLAAQESRTRRGNEEREPRGGGYQVAQASHAQNQVPVGGPGTQRGPQQHTH